MGGRTKPLVIVQAYEDRPLNAYSRTTTIPRESPVINKSNGVANDVPKRNFKPPDQPPPPPPMPVNNNNNNNNNKGFIPTPKTEPINKVVPSHTKPKAPPPPPLKKPIQNGNGNHLNEDRPPATPTPDYDTVSLIKVTNKAPPPNKIKSDIVEMESLESFKLNNPLSPDPKPPSTYFMKQQNGTLTMKKASQSISVTIGEYPTNTFRKQPAKLDFLNGDAVDGFKNNEPVGSRLQSELTQKLSRSNLKKKTELDKISNVDSNVNPFDSCVSDEPNANFHKRYGHVVLPQPPTISIPKVPIGKSLSHNPTMNGGTNDTNRIIVNTQTSNGKQELVKTESLPQNGILKSSAPLFATPIKIGMQHKSIKFGQTTTGIGDPEVPLIVNH